MKKRFLAVILALTMALASTACAAKSDNKTETTTVAPATTEESEDNKSEEAVSSEVETETEADIMDNELYAQALELAYTLFVEYPELNSVDIFDFKITEENKEFFDFAFITSVQSAFECKYNNADVNEFDFEITSRTDFDTESLQVAMSLVSSFTPFWEMDNKDRVEELVNILEENPEQFLEDVQKFEE